MVKGPARYEVYSTCYPRERLICVTNEGPIHLYAVDPGWFKGFFVKFLFGGLALLLF